MRNIQCLLVCIALIATSVALNLRSISHQQIIVWNQTQTTQNESSEETGQEVNTPTEENTSETPEGTQVWEGSLNNNNGAEEQPKEQEDCGCDPEILVQPQQNDPNIVITEPIQFDPFAQPQEPSQSSQLDNSQSGGIAEEQGDTQKQPSSSEDPQITEPTSIQPSSVASQPLLVQPTSTIATTTASQPQQSSPVQKTPSSIETSISSPEPNQTPITSQPQSIQPSQSQSINDSQLSAETTATSSQPLIVEPLISEPILTGVSADDSVSTYPQPLAVQPIIVSGTPTPSTDNKFAQEQSPAESQNLEYLSPTVVKPIVVA